MTDTTTTTILETPKALKARVTAALIAANAAPAEPFHGAGGCGRAYVCISSNGDRKLVNAVAAACKALGLLFLRKNYGAGGNAIYIGYDNARGDKLGKAEAFAKVLNASGIPCYTDAASD